MFRAGEKIVCINNSDETERLELYHIYTVRNDYIDKYNNQTMISVVENSTKWLSERFITLKKYRKEKLKKIYEREN